MCGTVQCRYQPRTKRDVRVKVIFGLGLRCDNSGLAMAKLLLDGKHWIYKVYTFTGRQGLTIGIQLLNC